MHESKIEADKHFKKVTALTKGEAREKKEKMAKKMNNGAKTEPRHWDPINQVYKRKITRKSEIEAHRVKHHNEWLDNQVAKGGAKPIA